MLEIGPIQIYSPSSAFHSIPQLSAKAMKIFFFNNGKVTVISSQKLQAKVAK